MKTTKIIIGSRGSDLALWQANHIKDRLISLGAEVEIKIFKTQGDKIQHLSLDKLEGKGFFTKELEEALLNKEIDLAVHSHKDLPTVSPEGLKIAAVSEREDPSEYILIRPESQDIKLDLGFKENAIVGTSSARRKAQLLSYRNDINLKDIRGNVPTRIQKLREGQFDAILLAKAGVSRLNLDLSDLVVVELDPRKFVPAPAQGVLALQIRERDLDLATFLSKIHQSDVQDCIHIERTLLNLFEGGCHMPLGAYAIQEEGVYKLWVAKSEDADEIPSRLYLESKSPIGMAEQALNLLNANLLSDKKVFISRDTDVDSFLKRCIKADGAELIGLSGIETKMLPLDKKDQSEYDFIFFNSKNAVRHFFEQMPKISNKTKFAAFGPSTAKALKQIGVDVSYIGDNSDPVMVANNFLEMYPNRIRVFFPKAKNSLQSVSKILATVHDVVEYDVYETIAHGDLILPEADVYIFTSPSNVDAFSSSLNQIKSKTLAIGPSTAEALRSKGVQVNGVANRADDEGLMEILVHVLV